MDDLKELRALRDRLLQSIGWYTGTAENGNTEVKTDEDRKSTRLNSSHTQKSRMPSSA